MNEFAQPAEIDVATAAFPGSVTHLIPPYADVRKVSGWGERLFSDWFYNGLKSTDGLVPREGIDKAKALKHINTVMRSWEPKHEHKTAACAYLFDKWFDGEKSTWEKAQR